MGKARGVGAIAGLGIAAIVIAGGLLGLGRLGDAGDTNGYVPITYDGPAMLRLTETLSSDALNGRATGTPGNAAARGFLLKRFETLGLRKWSDDYSRPFTIIPDEETPGGPTEGINLVGWIAGETPGAGPAIIITAHYDHIGVIDGEIHNGADDNASGSAALIAIAEHFTNSPPRHDLVIAALDAEEIGLLGARDLVRRPPIAAGRVALNINLDMVSRSKAGELYAAGAYHTPALKPLIADVAARAPVTLLMGHDRPEDGAGDWTLQSDHGPFHQAGIPFLYLGVEDHPGYHSPSDDYDKITRDFFLRSTDTIISLVRVADEHLPGISRDAAPKGDSQ